MAATATAGRKSLFAAAGPRADPECGQANGRVRHGVLARFPPITSGATCQGRIYCEDGQMAGVPQ